MSYHVVLGNSSGAMALDCDAGTVQDASGTACVYQNQCPPGKVLNALTQTCVQKKTVRSTARHMNLHGLGEFTLDSDHTIPIIAAVGVAALLILLIAKAPR